MAKRKMSTFERLQRGKMDFKHLKSKQREELGRRLQSQDPGLEIIHRNAAGIDVGSASHFVAVPPDRGPQPIREFGSWTAALKEMAAFLISCRVETVAVQATGVYWIALCDVLEAAGLKVWVVNAQGTKNLPGRKTDVQECEWIRRLHAYGLLRNSYRPPEEIRGIRDLWGLRQTWVKEAARAVQQMQKALTEMNIQLTNALSDLSGVSGMAIIRAMLAGERDTRKLAKLRDKRVEASEEEIAHSLEGTWREEMMFELRQVVALRLSGKTDRSRGSDVEEADGGDAEPGSSGRGGWSRDGEAGSRGDAEEAARAAAQEAGGESAAEECTWLRHRSRVDPIVGQGSARHRWSEPDDGPGGVHGSGAGLQRLSHRGSFRVMAGTGPDAEYQWREGDQAREAKGQESAGDSLTNGSRDPGKESYVSWGTIPLFEISTGWAQSGEGDGAVFSVPDLPTHDQRAGMD